MFFSDVVFEFWRRRIDVSLYMHTYKICICLYACTHVFFLMFLPYVLCALVGSINTTFGSNVAKNSTVGRALCVYALLLSVCDVCCMLTSLCSALFESSSNL